MIQVQSFNTAVPFAEQLATKGLTVQAMPGSVLGELTRLSAPVFTSALNSKEDMLAVGSMTHSVTQGTLESPTQHSLELDAYVKDLAKIVTSHISYAKNVIRPRLTEFADSIIAYQKTNKAKLASDAFTLKTLRMPDVLREESFLSSLSYYKEKTVLTPDLSFVLDIKNKEELNELVMTGSETVDAYIVQWLSHLPGDFLVGVWNTFFTKTTLSAGSTVVSFEDVAALNAFERANYALAIYLLSRKITDQVQSTTVPLSAYKNIAQQYTDYAGALLVDCISRIALMCKTKILVVSVDSSKKLAKLNGEIYGQWLNEGNVPETILGLIVSGNQPSSMDLINQKVQEYNKQWNSYTSYHNTVESNKAFQYSKDYILQAFTESLKNRDELEEEFLLKNPNHLQVVLKRVQEEVDGFKVSDLKDPYAVALCLVAKHRFYYTSAYQILSDIHQAGLSNPNVDVREAALLSVINYTADYLASQMVVSN